jgi:anti-anti-sigma factor
MKFTVDKQDKYSVLKVDEAKLMSDTAPQLKTELIMLNTEGYRNLVLDLSKVEQVDSSGLSAILIGNRICSEANGTFVITGINEQVKKLMEISQLNPVLNIIPTLDEGIDYVLMEEVERDFKENE